MQNLKEGETYFIHPSSYADEGSEIGAGTKIWHFCHIMPSAKIGRNCNIGQNVFIADGVVIGNSVKIQNNVSVYTGVICADNVFIGPSVVFTNVKNPRSAFPRNGKYTPTTIAEGASIGANATIVCGISIGKFAFIGAGAVVTKNVPDYAVIIGNPGYINGFMSEAGSILHFNSEDIAKCSETGDIYRKISGKVVKDSK